jgi:hypothetical protein
MKIILIVAQKIVRLLYCGLSFIYFNFNFMLWNNLKFFFCVKFQQLWDTTFIIAGGFC